MTHEIAQHVVQHAQNTAQDVNPFASLILGPLFGSPVLLVWWWYSRVEQARANAIHRQRRQAELVEKLHARLERQDALDRQKALAQVSRKDPAPAPVAQNKPSWVDDYKHWRN
jgi:hypothetical protein